MVNGLALGFVAKRFVGMILVLFVTTILSGCGYRLKKTLRQSTLSPNDAVELETTNCGPIDQVQANYVTNVVSSGDMFFVSLTTWDGLTLLYRVAPAEAKVSYRLPSRRPRLSGGSDSSITILDRWGASHFKRRSVTSIDLHGKPYQMQQSLLHEDPGQFAIEGNDQLFVIDGPSQAYIEASSLSHPVWRTIKPVLDATCDLPLAGFKSDTVFYDSSEHSFVALRLCAGSRVLAKSKDFADWRTTISLNQLVPENADNISAIKASYGSFLMKWRQPNGNWLAIVAGHPHGSSRGAIHVTLLTCGPVCQLAHSCSGFNGTLGETSFAPAIDDEI